ncbi:MAG: fumarylacetoacetate hydrolase family protein, partial [Fimbriimonadaceae bacterium]|nr:fumarylacetoacetate hydrolase family protein [Alphaproteobacteria bacterium]
SWNAGVVLGPWAPYDGDLSALKGILSLNGEVVDEGFGSDVLGHPFESLAWIANKLVARGGGLNAGDIVMTGSLIPTRFPEAGQSYRFDLGELGKVELEVAI